MKKIKPQIYLKLLIIWFVLLSNNAQSQLSGIYTIGGAASDFEDFDDAIYALKYEGVGGDVQFLVEPGEYFNVSIVDVENDENYEIQFNFNGSVNDTATIIGHLHVVNTINVSFKGFSIYPAINQVLSCVYIDESGNFLLENCHVLNLFNNNFDYDEALIKLEFPWSGAMLKAEIINCTINSENETMLYKGKQGEVYLKYNDFTGVIKDQFGYVEAYNINNIFHFTDYLFNSSWQTYIRNTIYYDGIYMLDIQGNMFYNIFHCDVDISSGSIRKNVFYGKIVMKWMVSGFFYGNTVFGEYISSFSHGINIISNTFFDNCILNNDNTKFGNNLVFDTVVFSHGPNQKVFNNNFGENAHLEFGFVSGEIKNNNINSLYIIPGQLPTFTIENNNFINLSTENVTSFGVNAHYYNPLYESDSILYSRNPLLIAKGTSFFSLLNFDIDSLPRKNPCTIGANEICYNWQVDEVNLCCGDSLCIDLCIDSLENMYWTPGFLFPDSNSTNPMIFPEDSVIIYLNCPDGNIYDSLIINTETKPPVAIATYTSDDLTVYFENKSICADEYYWDFGDGEFSKEESPIHGYGGFEVFQCVLTAFNESGSSSITLDVNIIPTSENPGQYDIISLFPNPTKTQLKIVSELKIESFSLINMNGQEMLFKEIENNNNIQINIHSFDKGVYLLRITTDQGCILKKVFKID